jgi:hypothetical protein
MKIQSLKSIILVLSLILLFCFSNYVIAQPNIKIQVRVIEKLSPDEFKQFKGSFYSANINIFNNTDTVVRFWTMSCWWEGNWITNYTNFSLFNRGCDKNYPIIEQINPKEKLTYKGIIQVSDTSINNNKNDIKLGLIFVKESEIFHFLGLDSILEAKRIQRKDIIWSEPFKITR